jgi:Trk K+ transport system NAD-binding subunit
LLREFRLPLLWFVLAMLGTGWLYYILSRQSAEPVGSWIQAVYVTMTLAFLQASIDFPSAWYLQAFFFVMPVIGIGILAQGLTEFGVMLFNRRARGKEWEMAVASTFNNHVILVGLGHLGFRVAKNLTELDEDVVAIEKEINAELFRGAQEMGVAVIHDDGTRDAVLENAGVQRARVIMLCTQNDALNLRMALKARTLNPRIEVVIRIFDDDFAASLQQQFGFHAMSATGMAAPLFAAIAAHIDITPPVTIEGKPHLLAQITINPESTLNGQSVHDLEENHRISVVMLCKDGERQYHPPGEALVKAGQTVAIFGEPEHIHTMLHENKA